MASAARSHATASAQVPQHAPESRLQYGERLRAAREVLRLEAVALWQVSHQMGDEIERALELLYACGGAVIVTGMGKAGLVGQKIAAKVGGAKRTLRVGVYPVRDGDEEDVGLLVTVRDADADERDPHEEKDHLTSLGELSAIVAHEIRNPLTGY